MKTQSLILYGSTTKLTSSHRPVAGDRISYFVRVEPSKLDYAKAFFRAKPKRGETILNTVPYETNT